jgi:hypothetical protein
MNDLYPPGFKYQVEYLINPKVPKVEKRVSQPAQTIPILSPKPFPYMPSQVAQQVTNNPPNHLLMLKQIYFRLR